MVKYMHLIVYDAAGLDDVHLYLDAIPEPTAVSQVAHVQSLMVAGYGSVTSSELSVTVDMATNAYALEVVLAGDYHTQLCGVRVDYIPPSIFAIALPHIAR